MEVECFASTHLSIGYTDPTDQVKGFWLRYAWEPHRRLEKKLAGSVDSAEFDPSEKMAAESNARPARSVTDRLFSILDLFAQEQRPLTLSQVTQKLGLPVGTTHRYLRELLTWGGLDRLEDGRYRLGRKMWLLGATSGWEEQVRRASAPMIHWLSQTTTHAVALTALNDGKLFCVDRMWGRDKSIVIAQSGGEVPLVDSSAGRVLLAQNISGGNAPLSSSMPWPVVGPTAARLNHVRQLGYEIAVGELDSDQAAVSVPIHLGSGSVRFALSVLAPASTSSLESFVVPLQKIAAAISRSV